MATEKTTIVIELIDGGNNYKMSIAEGDANGTRLDQQVAKRILEFDNRLRDPQTAQMINMFRQNPQAAFRQMMMGNMGGGMMPGAGRNMMWP